MNEQLEAEVLTRSSNSSKTSYAVAADLSEMELKKILIEKMEANKSIQRSNEQRNLYKALAEAYESDKIILDTYGDIVTLKRRRDDDADKDEEPSYNTPCFWVIDIETEPFKTDESAATPPPHPAYRTTARISIPAPVPMPAWTDSEVVRLLAISSPPASPLSPWSSPPPQIPFPPLPSILSPPSPVLSPAPPPSPIRSFGYRATIIRLRDEAASTSSPPLQLSSASRREDRPAAARPAGGFRADYGFVAMVDREIMRNPKREVGYGITDSCDEIVKTLQGVPVSTDTELGGYVREFETRVRQDTDEIYM
nr:hypothetical protein [Tanacetum cinerariifolium]